MLLSESPTVTAVHRRILALAFLGWMFDFYDLILYTFLVRAISDDLRLDHMQHARMLGASFAATAVGGVVSGWLADRYGRRRVVSWTILLYSAGSLASGLAGGARSLLAARIVTGLGVGGEWAAGHALVAETFPPAHRGRAGAILQTGAPTGVALATLVGTFAVPRIGWRACLIASSATALLAFAARRAMPESDLWQRGLTGAYGAGLRRLLSGPRIYLAFVLTCVNGASYWLTYSWMPEYLRSRGLSLGASGRTMAWMVGGELVGYSVFGFVSDHIGRRPAFTLFASTMAAGLVPITLWWHEVAARTGALTVACVMIGVGTGTWSNFGPMLAELFPVAVRATGMGAVLNCSRAVQLGAPILIAALEPRYGLGAGVGLAAAFALGAAALVWALPETRAETIA